MNGESEVIDLTDSFVLPDCYYLADVIELDDSIYYFPPTHPEIPTRQEKANKAENNKICATTSREQLVDQTDTNKPLKTIGECPICWDELGRNPLASTKCGHIFCLKCVEQALKQKPMCPTCRCSLKGRSAYHPIYLSLQ